MRATVLLSLLVVTCVVSGAGAGNNTQPKDSARTFTFQTPEPKTALQHNNRGVELSKHDMWAEAVKEHHLALIEDPGNKVFRTNLSSAHLQYGKRLVKKGDLMAATVQFHWAIYVDPDNKAASEELKSLQQPSASARSAWPSRAELDQFLKGKVNSLRGYDAVGGIDPYDASKGK